MQSFWSRVTFIYYAYYFTRSTYNTNIIVKPASSASVKRLWYRTEEDNRRYRALLQSTDMLVCEVCLSPHCSSSVHGRMLKAVGNGSLFTVLGNAVVVQDPSCQDPHVSTLGSNPTRAFSFLLCFCLTEDCPTPIKSNYESLFTSEFSPP